ncbi:hypothetical protein [Levilactobacillus zymae]|uniref:hypothetical protein n=1 Tax=Levilactobacillus zymae TaxID=267363 RepID=UPI001EE1CA7A|nr:hypothetical protein [Levilactobacillus zymae]
MPRKPLGCHAIGDGGVFQRRGARGYGVRAGLFPGRFALLFHPLWLDVAQPVSDQRRDVWLSAGQRTP